MKTNRLLLALLIMFTFFSCKKVNETWIQEDHLIADTAVAIQELKLINQTATELTIELDLVRLNGAKSEENYADLDLSFEDSYYNQTILTESIIAPAVTNEYSTIALFQSSSAYFYEGNKLTFALRRFFETIDQSPNKRLAIASRKKDENFITVHQSGADPFENSAEFNNNALHELIIEQNFNPNNGTGEDFLDQMLETIALFDECVSCSGQKSIIIFDNQDENFHASFAQIDSIITVANAANVQINVVCNYTSNKYGDLAFQTGGAIITNRAGTNVINGPVFSYNTLAVLVQSMDGFLSQSLTKHRYSYTLSLTDGSTIASDDLHSVNFIYSGQRFEVGFKVP